MPLDAVDKANSLLGTPYVFGGACPEGMDCSGLVSQVYPQFGRLSAQGFYQKAAPVVGPLQRGDLLFLKGTQPKRKDLGKNDASHVGLYRGDGTVISAGRKRGVSPQPLQSWLSNPNFLGAGRVGGTSNVAAKPPKQSAVPQISPSYGAGNLPLLDETGDLNFQNLLLNSLAQHLQAPAQYDPNAPTDVPNPNYAEHPFSDPLTGFTTSDQKMAPLGPSDMQRFFEQQQKGLNPTNPYLQRADELKAQADLLKAKADIYKTHPAAQMEVPPAEPVPVPQAQSIPNRPAPQLNPLAGILAGIAGAVAPRFAGQFGAAPLQAGLANADQQYADQMRRYQLQQQQLQREYEAKLQQHNENRQNALFGADVAFKNKSAQVEDARQSMLDAISGQSAGNLAGVLGKTGQDVQAAQVANLQASQIGQQIAAKQSQNAAANQLFLDQLKQQQDFQRSLLSPISSQQNAQTTAQTAAEALAQKAQQADLERQNKLKIAGSRNQTQLQIAQGHDTARKEVANINNQVNGLDTAALSPLDRIQFQGLVTKSNNSAKAVQSARGQVARMIAANPDYVDNITPALIQQAKDDAQAAADFYQQHRVQNVGGTPAGNTGQGAPGLSPFGGFGTGVKPMKGSPVKTK